SASGWWRSFPPLIRHRTLNPAHWRGSFFRDGIPAVRRVFTRRSAMSARIRHFLSLTASVLLAACAAGPTAPTAPRAPPAPPRDAVTAAAIERALGGEHRSAENRARDAWRHPVDTLLFFGIKPDMTVVEVWPGAGGWYTEVLAPLLRERGQLYAAGPPPQPDNEFVTAGIKSFRDKLAA